MYICESRLERSNHCVDFFLPTILPKVVVEWLTLLIRIREVPGSYLGPETILTDPFVVYLRASRKYWDSALKLGHDRFLANYFQYTYHHFIQRLKV
jgi:hypothetical protein